MSHIVHKCLLCKDLCASDCGAPACFAKLFSPIGRVLDASGQARVWPRLDPIDMHTLRMNVAPSGATVSVSEAFVILGRVDVEVDAGIVHVYADHTLGVKLR